MSTGISCPPVELESEQAPGACGVFPVLAQAFPQRAAQCTGGQNPLVIGGAASYYRLKEHPMTFSLKTLFHRDLRYEGVCPINIYLLRLVYILMFFVLGQQTWSHILFHQGPWEPTHAIAWCVWTAFATLAGLGILHPLRMVPILLLEIFYKVLWLILVAYPLWSKGTLAGSPAEDTTSAFLWVILPIVSVPWRYAFQHYIYKPKGARA